jgi:lysozyme family protein
MYSTYKTFLDRMIHLYEGGYGWDKGDPGGPTKYGVTCWDLAAYRGQKMTSMRTWAPIVKAMTLDEAEAIYWTRYALVLRYNDLPVGIDVTMFDYGVNSGVSRPVHVACAILGIPARGTVDGEMIAALKAVDPKAFITSMDAERLAFMRRLRTWDEFGRGWSRRVGDLRTYANTLLVAPAVPVDKTQPGAQSPMPKASHDDPKLTTKVGTGVATTLPGALAGHLGGVPMSYLVAIVVGVVLAGVGYYFYKKYAASVANTLVTDIQKVVPGATGPNK